MEKNKASIKFYGNCCDFLDKSIIEYTFNKSPSVKDAIESIGVPHTEVGAIRVNNQWLNFEHLVYDGDEIDVYPNPHQSNRLPYLPSGKPIFLLDVHLGVLVRYLRMVGINCLYESEDLGDEQLAKMAGENDYILLSRDIGLLKRGCVKYGHWMRNTSGEEQLIEVVEHYQLHNQLAPFTRCIKCNGIIEAIEAKAVKDKVPEGVYQWQKEFKHCIDCSQIYWQGTHLQKMMKILEKVKKITELTN